MALADHASQQLNCMEDIPDGLANALIEDYAAATKNPQVEFKNASERQQCLRDQLRKYLENYGPASVKYGGKIDIVLAAMVYRRPIYVFGRYNTLLFACDAEGNDLDNPQGKHVYDNAIFLRNSPEGDVRYNLLKKVSN
jgi:hypothetical protein